jgi:V/A-type H+-transporting ATPase subunit D
MMDADQLPPTRTSLLDLRSQLNRAVQGHDILEQKRETLWRKLRELLTEMKRTERQVRDRFEAAYNVQREARLMMGQDAMQSAGLAPAATTEYSTEVRSVMGVSLRLVTIQVNPLPYAYSPAGISAVFDELRMKWTEVGKILGLWVEINGSVWKVAAELGRTHRRVKALENLLIPKYEAAIRRIQAILDEQERESFIRTKRVKEQRER